MCGFWRGRIKKPNTYFQRGWAGMSVSRIEASRIDNNYRLAIIGFIGRETRPFDQYHAASTAVVKPSKAAPFGYSSGASLLVFIVTGMARKVNV